MQVVRHPSPQALEDELLSRAGAVKAGRPLAPILIVVPSRRLAAHVARRLVERHGAILGVEIVHHAALARRVLEFTGSVPPGPLHDALLETLASRVVRDARPGALRDFCRDHPAAVGALRGTLNDLREAGLAPADVTRELGREHAELAALFARWSSALEEVSGRGALDHAGIASLATASAAAFAARYEAIVHHGAYELIGVHDDLVAALDRGREVVFLQPSARDGRPAPLDVPTSFFDAQGASTELGTAARDALAAVARGVPPHEVAIVVRSFGPYAAAMDGLIDTGTATWNTSYVRPLRREPEIVTFLAALDADAEPGDATFDAHAGRFEAAAREALGARWNDTVGRTVAGLLDAMRGVVTLLGERRKIDRAEARAWLDARIDAGTLAPNGADGGGVRILDAMQARGLTFRQVALVGMNSGVFPRVGREDPFLSDAARARLTAATGRRLPTVAQRGGEERLLLSMILGSVRERLSVSWRRADDSGRPVVPSLALRDVACAIDVRKIPAHPRARLAVWAEGSGVLSRSDETLLAALSSETGAAAAEAVLERAPGLIHGVTLVDATDSFAPGSGRYDGRIGAHPVSGPIAATAIETLGRCPMQFFFRHVLRVRARPEPPTPFENDAAALGSRVHEVLRDVYLGLVAEQAFAALPLAARIARAKALARQAWETVRGEYEEALDALYPLLAAIGRRKWLAALDDFLAADLTRMEAEGVVPVAIEHAVQAPLPGADAIVIKAQFDRIVEGSRGQLVGEYKTGRNLEDRKRASAIVSGAQLQVPLYALLAGAPVELMGVGLNQVPAPGGDDARFVRFEGFKSADHRDGVLETVGVITRLAAQGRFPLRKGSHCEYCDYAAACRKGHAPTEHRDSEADDIADARDCWQKTEQKPTLTLLRTARVTV